MLTPSFREATQGVTVEAALTQVDTTTGMQKQRVINQTQMVELPLNGRNGESIMAHLRNTYHISTGFV